MGLRLFLSVETLTSVDPSDASKPCEQPGQLLSVARAGSLSALGQVLDHYRSYLLAVANNALDSGLLPKVAASDLVQDSLLQAIEDFSRFSGTTEQELRAWLTQVLLDNGCDAQRRYRGTIKRNLAREIALQNGGDSTHAELAVAAPQDPPWAPLTTAEERQLTLQALAKLSPEHRQVIELRSLEGKLFEEVGRIMGRSTDAVRKLWGRAVERLTAEMESHVVDRR